MAEHSEAYKRIMAKRKKQRIMKRRVIAGIACGLVVVGVSVVLSSTSKGGQDAKNESVNAADLYPYHTADEWEQIEREREAYRAEEKAEAEALRKSIEEYNEAYQASVEAEWLAAQADPNRYSFMEKIEREPIDPVQIGSLDFGADDAYLLAKIAMAEAESEPTETKALVILTVLNRVWSPQFPGTIEKVIFQDKQFTPIRNGRWDRVEPDADCWAALDLIYSGWNESQGALYFETTTDEKTWHNTELYKLFESGAISFYTEYKEADK